MLKFYLMMSPVLRISAVITFLWALIPASLHAEEQSLPDSGHSLKEETTKIKKHRMKKLEERVTVDETTLKEHCRFVSEIAAVPPAGEVVLTFDDGPEPGQTELILALLKKYLIPATFFMIGQKAEAHPDLVRQVTDTENTLIASHSWSHPNFHDIPVSEQQEEINKGLAIVNKENEYKLFRYPYGNSSCESNQLLKSLEYRIVGWHVDSCDWAFDHHGEVDAKEALSCGVLARNRKDYAEHVLSSIRAHNGGIILMHEIHPNTLKQLDGIIARLLNEGYRFKNLNDPGFQKALH